ncbi:GNAT family N-acetyltransferase [Phytomonospora sp. NPDC050363]|uniref:bifunctional acetate--CoA ligase family protein/GNAT family N-acetyltransferase n=1 Tax=Phytomonospora sp. NPDC050363 TaxID=3155642 RepID=UPI00340A6372
MTDMLATDGRIVRVRPVEPGDAERIRSLYEAASDDSLQLRFFSLGKLPIDREVARLTRPHDKSLRPVIASAGEDMVGIASYERDDDPQWAEFAVLVADEWHGHGVGTLLLEQLQVIARGDGIKELRGEALSNNANMLKVVAGLDSHARFERCGDTVTLRIPTELNGVTLAEVDARERVSEKASLQPLLQPRSVAVVGVGRRAGGVGREVWTNIREHGFTGSVYAVNPHVADIDGHKAFPTVSAVPEPVDLVVVAVPAPLVADVLRDAGAAGAGAAVILTAGFSETGPEGRAAQRELVDIARRHHMRLVGPNCLGVANAAERVRLAATFAATAPQQARGLAVATQSGAVGIAVLEHAQEAGLGISTFISLGNKADISGNDLLSYWYDDPSTRAVALYLESFGNPRKFARLARTVASRKPVLAIKSGRSPGGLRAGASHTAAAAAPDIAVESLFAQAGVIRVDTLDELVDAARVLVDSPLPIGFRLGVVGNAGGLNVLAADAASAAGLTLPEAVEQYDNPFDLGADADKTALATAVRTMADSDDLDSLLVIIAATRSNSAASTIADLATVLDEHPTLPTALVVVGLPDAPATVGSRKVPVFGTPERAVRALGHAAAYAAWRSRPEGTLAEPSGIDRERARAIVARALAVSIGEEGAWQPWEVSMELLSCYGIPVVTTRIAKCAAEARRAASEIGFPVAVKAADPALVHKTELGAVRLGLSDRASVTAAYNGIARGLGEAAPEVLVQQMRTGGVELVAGVVHDRLFGSLLMAGLGGVHTDLLGDRIFQLLPLTDVDAAGIWRRLRGAPLLTGFRGSAPVDTDAVEHVLIRIARLAEDFPEIAELDANPLLAFSDGVVAVDVKLRLSRSDARLLVPERALRD